MTTEATPSAPDLRSCELYFNRELSWLDFNARVLELAEDDGVPLLERVKFAAIFASNLDEFFMIRVAGVHDQVDAGLTEPRRRRAAPAEVLDEIRERVLALDRRHAQLHRATSCARRSAEHGIRIVACDEVGEDEREALDERFRRQIFPVLTPLAVGLGRPFPYISNLSLSLGVLLRDPQSGQRTFARVKVPKEMLDRASCRWATSARFVPLEEVIAGEPRRALPGDGGPRLRRSSASRATPTSRSPTRPPTCSRPSSRSCAAGASARSCAWRSRAGMDRRAARADRRRARGRGASRSTRSRGCSTPATSCRSPGCPGSSELRDPPWSPVTQPRLQGDDGGADVLAAMREGDILVHHPYDSFSTLGRAVRRSRRSPTPTCWRSS